MRDDLRDACRQALLAGMPDGLKRAIDDALANGKSKRDVLRFVKLKAGGVRSLTVLAVEEYLGADDRGRLP